MESTCNICDSPNAKACTRCGSARYCSPECQQTDWPSHRLLCPHYLNQTGRLNPSYKRAILFPPDEASPKFIWVECKIGGDDVGEDAEDGSLWGSSQVRKHLGGSIGGYDAFPERLPIQWNLLRHRGLSNSLVVVCRSTFVIDGSKMNKSVIKASQGAAGHQGAAGSLWKGPIVALKKQGSDTDPHFPMDVDMRDYRDVVDFFISYGNAVQDGEVSSRGGKGKVRGVKINCQGDQRTFGSAVFSAVDVPAGHPVFYNPIAQISKRVGMPVHTWKYPADRLWKNHHDDHSYENVPGTFLHQNADDVSSESWGWAPMQWQNNVGTVLVVRGDGQDVTTRQVEALCHFCQFKMQPLFENAMGDGEVQMTRDEVLGFLTPKAFGEYVAEMGMGVGD